MDRLMVLQGVLDHNSLLRQAWKGGHSWEVMLREDLVPGRTHNRAAFFL